MTSKEISDFFREHYGLASDDALGEFLGFPAGNGKQNVYSYRQRTTKGIETRMIAKLIEELKKIQEMEGKA